MSRKGQFSIFLGFLVLGLGLAARALLGFEFQYYSEVLYGLFVVMILVGVVIDRAFLADFFTMKTTKHGMNMGTSIVLVLILLVAVNYIAVSRDKKWDLTQEKLNTLSEQSIQVIRGLPKELTLIGFFKDGDAQYQQTKSVFLDIAEKMHFENAKVKYEVYDPDKRPDLKTKYNVSAVGDVVILYDGRQKLVSIISMLEPEQAEETLLNNVYVLSNNNGKTIYFLNGHNELDTNSEGREGLGYLKKSLADLNYEVKTINLQQTDKIPDDAKMIIIAGPRLPLYDGEIKILKDYGKNGGRILIASDPGDKNNIQKLDSIFGVDYKNDYIIDFNGETVGGSAYLAVGISYPEGKSQITKGFRANTNFNIASEVEALDSPGITHEIIVQSSNKSITRPELVQAIQMGKNDVLRSRNIGILTEGKIDNGTKNFKAIVYGDSNFMNNNDVQVSILNRDLILNSIAYLADQKELISIRPKKLKLSAFFITPTQTTMIRYGLFLFLPFFCLFASILLWYRRRNA